MSEVRFTDQHEWVRVDGDTATVGITKYAAGQLGDVVYVELPEAGRKVGQGGEVTDSNNALAEDPAKVNADPEGEGWFFKLKLASKDEFAKLMTADQYAE